MHDPSYVQRPVHIVLKCMSMKSGLLRSCDSDSQRRMNGDSMMQSKADLSCA